MVQLTRACTHASISLILFAETRKYSRAGEDIGDEVGYSFLQLRESVRPVFANSAYHCSLQIIIKGYEVG
jgi:hypothetical protein